MATHTPSSILCTLKQKFTDGKGSERVWQGPQRNHYEAETARCHYRQTSAEELRVETRDETADNSPSLSKHCGDTGVVIAEVLLDL